MTNIQEDILKVPSAQAEYHLNRNFVMSGHLPVNDFYEMLGLSAIDGGEYVGWNCDDGLYWIDFNHRKTVLDDGLEVYVIEMVWTPDTNWCDEEDFTMEVYSQKLQLLLWKGGNGL